MATANESNKTEEKLMLSDKEESKSSSSPLNAPEPDCKTPEIALSGPLQINSSTMTTSQVDKEAPGSII